jgi:large subunit ribosomal protein L35
MKTNKAIKSRFKVTKTKKLMRRKSQKRHLLTKKSANRKRKLSKPQEFEGTVAKKYKKLIKAA